MPSLPGSGVTVGGGVGGASGPVDAADVTVDSTNLDGTGTDLQTVLEELEDQIDVAGGLFDAYAQLLEVQAANTNGGTFTSGAWRTRTLNTEAHDPDGIVSLSGNRFTLQAGNYFIVARCPAYFVNRHKAKLVADPGGTPANVIIGSSEYSGANPGVMSWSEVRGRITPGAATAYEIQHQCEVTLADLGFGVPSNFSVSEIYTEVEIWREA